MLPFSVPPRGEDSGFTAFGSWEVHEGKTVKIVNALPDLGLPKETSAKATTAKATTIVQ